MIYYIGSARIDERGKAYGGKNGDQTGLEVCTQKMYNSTKGWIGYRAKDPKVAAAIKNAMLTACANPNNGYDQYRRYDIIKNGVDTTIPGGCDCSSTVRACIIEATGKDIGDFTTASEHAALKNSGLFTCLGTVTTLSNLNEGDILVTKRKGHTAVVTTGHVVATPSVHKATSSGNNAVIKTGQTHSNNFTGHIIAEDGIRDTDTRRQAVRVLQHAINLDYHAGLSEDGILGNKTMSALGSHYVKKGEKQYMVTAAEILCLLNGRDPNGVECPGVFGNGLVRASGSNILRADWFKQMVQ